MDDTPGYVSESARLGTRCWVLGILGAGGSGSYTWHRDPPNTPANALWLSSLPEACRAEAFLCGRARAVSASVDGVDDHELQPHAVVADVNELVDSLDALLVSGEGQLLPLALLDLLGPAEAEEASTLLGAHGGYGEEVDRVSQLVDSGVHRDGLLGDRLPRERARPQLHRPKDAVNAALLLNGLVESRPVAGGHRLLHGSGPVVAPALDARHVARVRLLPRHERLLGHGALGEQGREHGGGGCHDGAARQRLARLRAGDRRGARLRQHRAAAHRRAVEERSGANENEQHVIRALRVIFA